MSAASSKAASVRQRLLNRARAQGEDFQALLARYVLERFLYRLSRSPHRKRFVVKGAMLFVLWESNLHRMTRDLASASAPAPSPTWSRPSARSWRLR